MRKTIILLIVIAIVLIIGVVAVIFFRGSSSPVGGSGGGGGGTLPPVTTPTSPIAAPGGSTFTIGTTEGPVVVSNFYKNASLITSDQQTVVLTDNAKYTVVYNTSDSSFVISLLSIPLADARTAAENGFLQQLGISQGDACKLSVNEGVPLYVTTTYPGVSLGLSFCPGAVGL